MDISLDLRRHCIQTAIKQTYNRRISAYFKTSAPGPRHVLEAEIALLKTALETLDFAALRSDFPALQGGGPEDIRIGQGTGGVLYVAVNGKAIYETISNHPVS